MDANDDEHHERGPDAHVDLLQIRIRERLAAMRKRAAMTQGELGRRLGIARQHASALEGGRLSITTRRLAALEQQGFDLTELVQVDGGPTRTELARLVLDLLEHLADETSSASAFDHVDGTALLRIVTDARTREAKLRGPATCSADDATADSTEGAA